VTALARFRPTTPVARFLVRLWVICTVLWCAAGLIVQGKNYITQQNRYEENSKFQLEFMKEAWLMKWLDGERHHGMSSWSEEQCANFIGNMGSRTNFGTGGFGDYYRGVLEENPNVDKKMEVNSPCMTLTSFYAKYEPQLRQFSAWDFTRFQIDGRVLSGMIFGPITIWCLGTVLLWAFRALWE